MGSGWGSAGAKSSLTPGARLVPPLLPSAASLSLNPRRLLDALVVPCWHLVQLAPWLPGSRAQASVLSASF